jgi:hypothetical protein
LGSAMESLRNAINEHLTSFIEDHQKRLANAEAATSVLKSTDISTSAAKNSTSFNLPVIVYIHITLTSRIFIESRGVSNSRFPDRLTVARAALRLPRP